MKPLLFFVFLFVCHQSFGQGCFGKCLDHLKQPLNGQEDVKRRIAQSEKILKKLVGCEAPDFNVKTIKGETLALHELRGKVVVINFWFESCASCIADIPALNRLADEFKDRDVVFIAFGKDSEFLIEKFLQKRDFNYAIVSGRYDLVNDYCVIAGWPMNMVIDREGIVKFIKAGGNTDELAKSPMYDLMKPVIDEALGGS
ncbi:MAG TPA: TlpA disulfide reductase family protein [Chryseosolibacter sp.]